jgi:hypothetical protein
LAAGVATVVVVIVLLRSEPGPLGTSGLEAAASGAPRSAAAPPGGRIPTPTDPGFPSPPQGATILSREAGDDALGFALVPGSPRSLVRVSLINGAGSGASGLNVSVSVGGRRPVALTPCGAGCYEQQLSAGSGDAVAVRFSGRSYRLQLPTRRDLPDGTRIVERAGDVWRALKTLVWKERLASSPVNVLSTVYKAVAPDELSYTIAGQSAAVIIGERRWDRPSPTAAWVESAQIPPLQVPLPFWYSVSDAHVLGSTRVAGRPVWTISFFDPTTPAWFTAEIDKKTSRTLELWMIAAGHFMHHRYLAFNSPMRLRPPVNS